MTSIGSPLDRLDALKGMMRIRAFETVLARRKDHGFQLLSSGEEAVAIGLCASLGTTDDLLTGGRSIGPALARGVDPVALMAELLGRSAGINGGRAGRGHLSDPQSGFFGAHAVVGGNISVAAGVALVRKLSASPSVVVVMFGDGACGQGVLHETLNIAAKWRLPLLFLCNNNGLSVSTPWEAVMAPKLLSDLGASFGMPAKTIDGLDVEEVAAVVGNAVATIRNGGGPAFIEARSVRLTSHSTTARETRSRSELEALNRRCPITVLAARMGLSAREVAENQREAEAAMAAVLAAADASAYPSPEDVLTHVG
jgi:TPP-dependent pyruvate/acetoin dehydrogenase alpha subunit